MATPLPNAQDALPRSWWGMILLFVKSFFKVGTDLTNVVETVVEIADVQVTAASERLNVEVALEQVGHRDQAIARAALANAQSQQALADYAAKSPAMQEFMKNEVERLNKAVDLFMSKRVAAKAA